MGKVKVRVEKQIGRYTLSFETGYLAKQAAGAVMVQYGDTVVLNAVATGPPRPGIDFFPLMCDYRERTSAAGKFPGGFLKREGRPSMKETLTSRLMDRPIRPLFSKGFNDEVQCQSFVLSSDRLNDADVLAMNGCSAALMISPLPFPGRQSRRLAARKTMLPPALGPLMELKLPPYLAKSAEGRTRLERLRWSLE